MMNEIRYPYEGIPIEKWRNITEELIAEFPLTMETLVSIVKESWEDLFTITNRKNDFQIGLNVFPKPQMMGFFLEELITRKIQKLDPEVWVADPTGFAKDLININNPIYSVEIKTSSSKNRIYGNRSYGKKAELTKKAKDGYYLAVNFEKFKKDDMRFKPSLTMIRFGFLNHTDWVSQSANSGQAAHIPVEIERLKLITIWEKTTSDLPLF